MSLTLFLHNFYKNSRILQQIKPNIGLSNYGMTFCSQLLDTHCNTIDANDTVSHVLELNQDEQQDMLVVLEGQQYMGMIDLGDLEDADPQSKISEQSQFFIKPFVNPADHFLQALKVRSKFFIKQVPVINEKNELEGMVNEEKLLEQSSLLLGVAATGSVIILEMPRHEYSPGEINRLVESNDAMIMNMNSILDTQTAKMQVVLHINREDISDLVATFQRHEYTVLQYYGDEYYDNSLQSNLDHLLNYLNI